jgi:hypothetical protein
MSSSSSLVGKFVTTWAGTQADDDDDGDDDNDADVDDDDDANDDPFGYHWALTYGLSTGLIQRPSPVGCGG